MPLTRRKAPKVRVLLVALWGRKEFFFQPHMDEQAVQFAYRWARKDGVAAYVFIGRERIVTFDGNQIQNLATDPPRKPVVDGVELQRQVALARHAQQKQKPKRRMVKHA